MTKEVFEKLVRAFIYDHFVETGKAPTLAHCAQALSRPIVDIELAYRRLAEGRALVLQEDGEILMAEPFSAVPTAFYVEVGGNACWGNCIWDALGIPAMLKENAQIFTSCGCCNDAMTVEIRNRELLHPSGLVHIALPPKDWWNDVVFA